MDMRRWGWFSRSFVMISPQAALALGQAEPSLHFHSLTFVQKILRLGFGLRPSSAAQRGPRAGCRAPYRLQVLPLR